MINKILEKEFNEFCQDMVYVNVLNLGAGKSSPLVMPENKPWNLINIDEGYFQSLYQQNIDDEVESVFNIENCVFNYGMNCNKFMEKTRLMFDMVVLYRYLEHVPFTDIEYFIYLVSKTVNIGGYIDIIVPDYKTLAGKILFDDDKIIDGDEPGIPSFREHNILLTTELLNEKYDPHCSIWTPKRIKYFWELEKRFKVIQTMSEYYYDGRNTYLRSIIKRV